MSTYITVANKQMSKKFYRIDTEDKIEKRKVLDHIEYAMVTFNKDNLLMKYSLNNEYVLVLKGGHTIEVSKEDFDRC